MSTGQPVCRLIPVGARLSWCPDANAWNLFWKSGKPWAFARPRNPGGRSADRSWKTRESAVYPDDVRFNTTPAASADPPMISSAARPKSGFVQPTPTLRQAMQPYKSSNNLPAGSAVRRASAGSEYIRSTRLPNALFGGEPLHDLQRFCHMLIRCKFVISG